jgi:hypothetical protein
MLNWHEPVGPTRIAADRFAREIRGFLRLSLGALAAAEWHPVGPPGKCGRQAFLGVTSARACMHVVPVSVVPVLVVLGWFECSSCGLLVVPVWYDCSSCVLPVVLRLISCRLWFRLMLVVRRVVVCATWFKPLARRAVWFRASVIGACGRCSNDRCRWPNKAL